MLRNNIFDSTNQYGILRLIKQNWIVLLVLTKVIFVT